MCDLFFTFFSFPFLISVLVSFLGGKEGKCPPNFHKICVKALPELMCSTSVTCKGDNVCCQTGCEAKLCVERKFFYMSHN